MIFLALSGSPLLLEECDNPPSDEINQFTNSSLLKIDDKRQVEHAQSHTNGPIEIRFILEDACRFVQNALEIGGNDEYQSLP
jgi:hypothetical protein